MGDDMVENLYNQIEEMKWKVDGISNTEIHNSAIDEVLALMKKHLLTMNDYGMVFFALKHDQQSRDVEWKHYKPVLKKLKTLRRGA